MKSESTRLQVVKLVIWLTFVFLFVVLFVDKELIKVLAIPAFGLLGVTVGLYKGTKMVEHSKWSKPSE